MGIRHVITLLMLILQMEHAKGIRHVVTLIILMLDRVLAKEVDLVSIPIPIIMQTMVVCVVMDCLQHMISQKTHVLARIRVKNVRTIWDVLAQVDATYMYQMVTLTRA